MTDKSELTLLGLSLELGSSNMIIKILLNHYTSLYEIWDESKYSLEFKTGIKGQYLNFLNKKNKILDKAYRENEKIVKNNIKLVSIFNSNYSQLLKNIYDPPVVLYAKGNVSLLSKTSHSVVGTRKPTEYGILMAYRISSILAEAGIVVVSGAARGIDTYAHRGALEKSDNSTIAVLGSGIDYYYPRENYKLLSEIAEKGLIISEYPIGSIPRKFNFPRRNRIISGLSTSTIVVQAPGKSGALITANFALEQGRDVYACPWSTRIIQGWGCLNLLAEGAIPVIDGNESLTDTCVSSAFKKSTIINKERCQRDKKLTKNEKNIISLLGYEKISIDEIISRISLSVNLTNASLMNLELKGLVKNWGANQYTKVY